ncbi:choice-of-anchor M domain-containing protein [Kribbella sp. CA-293567]|uniref:choice-of-anchor M domain-containing protein n=1 Tax=Kribbella sp. CA-293567 TaxID=3002436 RepID=UPI0022DD4D01|nr:choice-of-anchor M domain-containing protein [Kribbella sp. CA-293567]WBQ06798.1 choice-of-anchor M domain-containing protein [Kribbella sp. CA-293567]
MTATHPRFRAALLTTLTAAVACCLALVPLHSSAEPSPEVLQAVHTDALHTTYDGSALRLNTRIGLGDYREADPAGLIFNLEDKASARVELPDLPAFAFLGRPGDPVWIAPESQDPELLWPGWDTETIAPGALAGDAIDLTLLTATGPGNVEIFFNFDEFTGAAERLFSAADPALRTVHQPIGRHVHANWAFTALGTYHLTFQSTATTTAGVPLTSGPVTYTFVVGPYVAVPPTSPPTTPPTTPPVTPPTTPPPTTPPPGTPPTTPPGTPPTTSPGTPTPGTSPPVPPSSLPPSTPPTTRPSATPTPTPSPTTSPSSPPAAPPQRPTPRIPTQAPTSRPPLPPCLTTTSPATTSTSSTTPNPTTNPTSSLPTSTTPGPTTPSTPNPARKTLSTGHADYAVRLENQRLSARIKDGTAPGTPVWRDPAKVAIRLTAAAATRAPGGAFAFLGPAGSPLWQIPQTQKDGVIWLGWNTEEITAAQLTTGVDWRLDKVTGPGAIAVFEFDSFGQPKIIFNSTDGLPDTYRIPLGTHAHGNWSFTKPGTYQATFTHSATLKTGARSTTTSTVTFLVAVPGSNASGGARPAADHPAEVGAADRHHTPSRPAAGSRRSAQGSSSTKTQVGQWWSPGKSGGADRAAAANVLLAGSPPSATNCKLASTGAEIGPAWIGGGATLVVIGVVTLVATRRRRSEA